MVLDQEHAVKTELFGFADVIDVVGVDPAIARLLAGIGARAAEQSEPHLCFLSTRSIPLPHRGRGWPRATARGQVRVVAAGETLTLPARYALGRSLSRNAGEGLS